MKPNPKFAKSASVQQIQKTVKALTENGNKAYVHGQKYARKEVKTMYYPNMCRRYCEPESVVFSKIDRKALLEEEKAILGAKLATISHLIDSLDKEEKE